MRYLSFLLLIAMSGCESEEPAADVILSNGYIYTVDSTRSVVDSIAIRGNRIVALGDASAVMEFAGSETDVRDLEGNMVLPGLHDMHIHAMGSVQPDVCDIGRESLTLDELVEFLRSCLDKYQSAADEWLPVIGWNPFEGNQPSANYATIRAALDAVSQEHPIILWGFDAHHGAANSLALASPDVPINATTLQSEYVHIRPLIEVDEDGNPSGGINEEARLMLRDMDDDFLGVAAPSEWIMPRLAEGLARSGITSIQDPAGTAPILDHYLWLARSGEMTFRLRMALRLDLYDPATARITKSPTDAVDEVLALRDSAQGVPFICADAVKIFADDVLEGDPYSTPPTLPNAAMLDGFLRPEFEIDENTGIANVVGYSPIDSYAAGYTGELVHEPEVLNELVSLATTADFHVHAHTIADTSVRAISDAFELAHEDAVSRGLTQSIAHLQIAKTQDVRRLGELGVFVAFTYMWANPEPLYEMVVIPFIDEIAGIDDLYNPEHYYVRNAYPFRTALESGALPVFGSDVPVGSRNPRPFRNMQAALTRESDGIVLNESETLDIHETIAAFTINGAQLMTHDDELGSLELGKIADLIVIDRNIVEQAEAGEAVAVGQTEVLMTIFDGRIIFEVESPR